jgi:hypothetical protein
MIDDIFDTTARALAILEDMRGKRLLTPLAVSKLRAAMLANEDAYPYYSADRRPYVWSDGERFTAQAYNARAQREALEAEAKKNGDAGASIPLVLWRMPTVGFYYTDGDGRAWATWSGASETCALCGATISHGYATPDMANDPARYVCVSHVATYGDSAGRP